MLCERIKSKTQTHHKDTPRQHSLKKILVAAHLLILSLFPCNKDSENLLQKNMLEICRYWVVYGSTKKLRKKKPIFFRGVGYHSQNFTRFFWLFCHVLRRCQHNRHTLQDVPACSRLLSVRLAVKNPTY